jgi:hypothetical protein
MRGAATPGTVDRRPPRLSIRSWSPEDGGDRVTVAGTASDEFGIRVVRWYDDRGNFGAAELLPPGEDGLTLDPRMEWQMEGVPLPSGTNRVTVVAEDIKGLARTQRLRLGGSARPG